MVTTRFTSSKNSSGLRKNLRITAPGSVWFASAIGRAVIVSGSIGGSVIASVDGCAALVGIVIG